MRRGAGVTGRIIGAASSGKRRRGSCVSSKLVDDVAAGPITETDAQHAARHRTMQRGCPRCVYNANRRQLESSWGSYKHASGSHVLRTVWLAPRPVRLGGAWGVGCKFCDFLRQRRLDAKDDARREGNAKPKRRRGPNDANTRWARFEIRSEEQIACRGVRQHSETQQHRIAARVYLSPDSAVTVLEPTAADAELFRGSVPQLDDWLLAWRACRTPQSFYAAEAHGVTCNYIRGSRMQRTSRKAFKSMVDVMAMALRERKRMVLQAATVITLVMDARGGFRLVSFRCFSGPALIPQTPDNGRSSGVPGVATGCRSSGVPGVATGCLAILRHGGAFSEKELADCDEDYSEAMAHSIVRAIRRICTCARTDKVDEALVTQICHRVRMAVADGHVCAQKCLRFLATGPMPNLLWCGRDRAHAMRISTTGALLEEQTFKAWWTDTFGGREALVPPIQNSDEFLAKLALCQKAVIKCSGVQGFTINKVAKTLSFAKQRFDSFAGPQFTFCVIFQAIAMLLAYVASDRKGNSPAGKLCCVTLFSFFRKLDILCISCLFV